MPNEIDEIVSDSIEDMAVEDLVKEEVEKTRKPRWEVWIALFSSLLAILSAVAALLANFASDAASVALAKQSDYSSYAAGLETSGAILKTKLDILEFMGKPPLNEDLGALQRIKEMSEDLRKRAQTTDEKGKYILKAHDKLVIAVTLFQVHMLLGGLAVMVERLAIWGFGLLFSGGGFVYLCLGLIGYLSLGTH